MHDQRTRVQFCHCLLLIDSELLLAAVCFTATNVDDSPSLIWEEFDSTAAVVVVNPQSSAMSLVRQYIEEPNIARNQDPLAWWKERVHIYRQLVPLAKKYMCIVATSVPSERVFSKSGQLISARRSRLAPKTVQMVMFLNSNYKLI